MRAVKLTNSKRFFIVDDEDYERVNQFNWYLKTDGKAIYRYNYNETVYIATFISGKKDGYEVDHIDRDIYNNQKSNLRYATHSQNNANKPARIDNTSGYKGVGWNNAKNKWHAKIKVNGLHIHLGLFIDKNSAARAYNEAAIKYFGEFAYLNEIKDENS